MTNTEIIEACESIINDPTLPTAARATAARTAAQALNIPYDPDMPDEEVLIDWFYDEEN